jgi:hypothetical protein
VAPRPPRGGPAEGKADDPEHDSHDDGGDDPAVHRTEPKRADEARGPAYGNGQHGDGHERRDRPLDLEETVESDPCPDSFRAEHLLRVERRETEVRRHLRPPEEDRSHQPDRHRDDGYGRGSGNARRCHL